MPALLPQLIKDCEAQGFAQRLKQTLRQLPTGSLPLHQATTQGGLVDDSRLDISLISHRLHEDHLAVRIAVFFDEIVGGCNCHDDPVPANAYCLLDMRIDRTSGLSEFTLVDSDSAC